MFYSFAWAVCRILFKLLFRLKVVGKENIPRKGPALIAPNHISFLDPIAVGVATKGQMYYMAHQALFAIPLLGWLLKNLNSFPVKRGRPDPQAMRMALGILKRGKMLLVFPEGTRSLDGKLQPGRRGVGMLSFRSKVAVIPALVVGSDRALPVDARWIRMERIEVRFGKAIPWEEFPGGENRHSRYQAISDKIMEEIKNLRDGD